jgi:hypothetical protein
MKVKIALEEDIAGNMVFVLVAAAGNRPPGMRK